MVVEVLILILEQVLDFQILEKPHVLKNKNLMFLTLVCVGTNNLLLHGTLARK